MRLEDLPCDELRPEDGLDSRAHKKKRRRKVRRKDHQLCKQVFQALSMALACLQHLPWAARLYIESVTPAPNAARLKVAVATWDPLSREEATHALSQVRGQAASLRWEVGAAICRKRVPELFFVMAGDSTEELQVLQGEG